MDLEAIISEARALIDAANDVAGLDTIRVEFMGKKGKLTEQMKGLGKLSAEERPIVGQKINQAKQTVQGLLSEKGNALKDAELNAKLAAEKIDVTLPGKGITPGNLHPVSRLSLIHI